MENLASLIRLVVLTVDGQTYALHLETTGRILRMAEITPLPGARDAAEGVVDVQGEVVPSSVVHGMPGGCDQARCGDAGSPSRENRPDAGQSGAGQEVIRSGP